MIRTRSGGSPGGGSGSGSMPTQVSAFTNDVPYLTASAVGNMQSTKLAMTAVQPAQLNSAIAGIVPVPGPKGDTGATGATGAASTVAGPKGDTGATGATGAKGDAGTAGSPGAKGDTGSNGAKGDKGETGSQGLPGIDGAQGSAGLPGAKGADAPMPSQAPATRPLNTAYQINATRPCWVTYSVQITVTANISSGQTGDVILEIASNAAFTTNVQTVAIAGLGQTYSLAVAIMGVQPQTGVVSGLVPPGYYARLRTVNTVGTPAYLFRAGQETTL